MSTAPLPTSSTAVAARLRTIDLKGPAGRLEAVLNEGAANSPAAALVCHPHPKGGGTLHNKVVYHAMKALNAPEFGLSLPVLRFNFRGTGLSEGEHDGRAESDDVRVAVDWLVNAYKLPIVLVGFSFGAAMSLLAACGGAEQVKALAVLGLPTHAGGRDYHYSFLDKCSLPKLFLSGDRDQYAPSGDLERIVAHASGPKKLVLISGADHFFSNQLDAMQNMLASWVKEQLA